MMAENAKEQIYLLLDEKSSPLARGIMEGPETGESVQIRVLDGKEYVVADHNIIQVVGMDNSGQAFKCQLVRRRGERFLLNRIASLGPEFRRNLRVPVKFKSFIYPISGSWKGRREVESVDISCGGVAFNGEYGLENGEKLEIVVPITAHPLIMRCQILRQQDLRNNQAFYASKFVDMCNDEETIVREAVFRVQLQDRPRRGDSADHDVEV